MGSLRPAQRTAAPAYSQTRSRTSWFTPRGIARQTRQLPGYTPDGWVRRTTIPAEEREVQRFKFHNQKRQFRASITGLHRDFTRPARDQKAQRVRRSREALRGREDASCAEAPRHEKTAPRGACLFSRGEHLWSRRIHLGEAPIAQHAPRSRGRYGDRGALASKNTRAFGAPAAQGTPCEEPQNDVPIPPSPRTRGVMLRIRVGRPAPLVEDRIIRSDESAAVDPSRLAMRRHASKPIRARTSARMLDLLVSAAAFMQTPTYCSSEKVKV
jgi:hypothetical protein